MYKATWNFSIFDEFSMTDYDKVVKDLTGSFKHNNI